MAALLFFTCFFMLPPYLQFLAPPLLASVYMIEIQFVILKHQVLLGE
jgi:hypothetical protein